MKQRYLDIPWVYHCSGTSPEESESLFTGFESVLVTAKEIGLRGGLPLFPSLEIPILP